MIDILVKFGFQDEKKLLKRCLAKDKKAWDAFVERYERLISNAILQTLNKYSVDQADRIVPDLFHTVFLSLIEDDCKKLRQFKQKSQLSTWLHVIAVRVTIDYLRKESKHLLLDGDKVLPEDGEITNWDPLPDVLMELKQEREIFQKIKKLLTSREQLFIELYYTRELASSKIAAILKTTENNVYQLKNRIREKMKKIADELL